MKSQTHMRRTAESAADGEQNEIKNERKEVDTNIWYDCMRSAVPVRLCVERSRWTGWSSEVFGI